MGISKDNYVPIRNKLLANNPNIAEDMIKRFVTACRKTPERITIVRKAQDDAREFFGLSTTNEIKVFIGANGLQEVTSEHIKPFENYSGVPPPPIVYSYLFRTESRRGYLAFYEREGKWTIKSFHLPDDVNDSMKIAVESFMHKKKEIEERNHGPSNLPCVRE